MLLKMEKLAMFAPLGRLSSLQAGVPTIEVAPKMVGTPTPI